MLTCLALDDEPLALHVVSSHIERTPFLRLVGAFTSALEALDTLRRTPVDLLFLDIRMPELNGLDVARTLAALPGAGPRIVFTTAFPQFALDGFRLDALDYLLKPIEYPDFLRVALKAQTYVEAMRQAPSEPPATPVPDTIVLRVDYYLVRVPLDDILYVEGLKDYVKVHRVGGESLLSLSSLRAIEERLPTGQFARLHRSFIVNRRRIEALGRHAVRVGGVTVPVGLQYRETLQQLVREWEG